MDSYLPEEKQRILRQQGVLQQDEVAIQMGDILLAEHVITRERRIITPPVNEGRRILKG
jgi:hypothetical protein